jgi:hypothetical protein
MAQDPTNALEAALAGWVHSAWLDDVLASIRGGGPVRDAMRAFVAASRHVGRDPLAVERGALLRAARGDVAVDGWTADRSARVAILCALDVAAPSALPATIDALHREGDNREKVAIVSALGLLSAGERFVHIALDAGRTNDSTVFRALACDNPYPAEHYPELEFNKLVMKAAFVGAPIDRIIDLDRRANAELSRMGMESIDEQESARRRFPPEILSAIALHPRPGSVARMLGYLCHSVAENRLWAARALGRTRDTRAVSFLEERRAVEKDGNVRDAIATAIEQLTHPG